MTAPQRQWRRPSGDGVYFVRSADSMALSKIARDFAREISNHHWSDAPYRRDRAGHNRDSDTRAGDRVLNDQETDAVRTNVMWVTAQVLGYHDPNFNVYEFAEACGVDIRTRGATWTAASAPAYASSTAATCAPAPGSST